MPGKLIDLHRVILGFLFFPPHALVRRSATTTSSKACFSRRIQEKFLSSLSQGVRCSLDIQAEAGALVQTHYGTNRNYTIFYLCAGDLATEATQVESQSHRRVGGEIAAAAHLIAQENKVR